MEQPVEKVQRSRSRCRLVVLLVMLAGWAIALAGGRRVWMAPPATEVTVWLYAASVWAWLPIWVVCEFRRYRSRAAPGAGTQRLARWALTAVVALGPLLSCLACVLFVPSEPLGIVFATWECRPEGAREGMARYTCVYDSIEGISRYALEGPEGWPIVFVVDWEVESK